MVLPLLFSILFKLSHCMFQLYLYTPSASCALCSQDVIIYFHILMSYVYVLCYCKYRSIRAGVVLYKTENQTSCDIC